MTAAAKQTLGGLPLAHADGTPLESWWNHLYANTGVSTTLAAALTDTVGTSIRVSSISDFPVTVPFNILVDNEEMRVTSLSGTSWTVVRAINGRIARTHLNGATVTLGSRWKWFCGPSINPTYTTSGGLNGQASGAYKTIIGCRSLAAFNREPGLASCAKGFTVTSASLMVYKLTSNNVDWLWMAVCWRDVANSRYQLMPGTQPVNFQSLISPVLPANNSGFAWITMDTTALSNPAPITYMLEAARTTLSVSVGASAGSVQVASLSGLPVASGTVDYILEIDNERYHVTSISGTTLTVTAGYNGTQSVPHTMGATAILQINPANVYLLVGAHTSDAMSGLVTITTAANAPNNDYQLLPASAEQDYSPTSLFGTGYLSTSSTWTEAASPSGAMACRVSVTTPVFAPCLYGCSDNSPGSNLSLPFYAEKPYRQPYATNMAGSNNWGHLGDTYVKLGQVKAAQNAAYANGDQVDVIGRGCYYNNAGQEDPRWWFRLAMHYDSTYSYSSGVRDLTRCNYLSFFSSSYFAGTQAQNSDVLAAGVMLNKTEGAIGTQDTFDVLVGLAITSPFAGTVYTGSNAWWINQTNGQGGVNRGYSDSTPAFVQNAVCTANVAFNATNNPVGVSNRALFDHTQSWEGLRGGEPAVRQNTAASQTADGTWTRNINCRWYQSQDDSCAWYVAASYTGSNATPPSIASIEVGVYPWLVLGDSICDGHGFPDRVAMNLGLQHVNLAIDGSTLSCPNANTPSTAGVNRYCHETIGAGEIGNVPNAIFTCEHCSNDINASLPYADTAVADTLPAWESALTGLEMTAFGRILMRMKEQRTGSTWYASNQKLLLFGIGPVSADDRDWYCNRAITTWNSILNILAIQERAPWSGAYYWQALDQKTFQRAAASTMTCPQPMMEYTGTYNAAGNTITMSGGNPTFEAGDAIDIWWNSWANSSLDISLTAATATGTNDTLTLGSTPAGLSNGTSVTFIRRGDAVMSGDGIHPSADVHGPNPSVNFYALQDAISADLCSGYISLDAIPQQGQVYNQIPTGGGVGGTLRASNVGALAAAQGVTGSVNLTAGDLATGVTVDDIAGDLDVNGAAAAQQAADAAILTATTLNTDDTDTTVAFGASNGTAKSKAVYDAAVTATHIADAATLTGTALNTDDTDTGVAFGASNGTAKSKAVYDAAVTATHSADAATLTAATLNTNDTDTTVAFGASNGTAKSKAVYDAAVTATHSADAAILTATTLNTDDTDTTVAFGASNGTAKSKAVYDAAVTATHIADAATLTGTALNTDDTDTGVAFGASNGTAKSKAVYDAAVTATHSADAATLTAATLNTNDTDTTVAFGASNGTAKSKAVYDAAVTATHSADAATLTGTALNTDDTDTGVAFGASNGTAKSKAVYDAAVTATHSADAATLTAATLNTNDTDTTVAFGASNGTAKSKAVYDAGLAAAQTSPTAAEIAAAVWTDADDLTTPGSIGAIIANLSEAAGSLSPAERDAIADALLDRAEALDGKTPRQALRYIAAICAGRLSGAATSAQTFLGLDGATPRLAATVDESGNRTAITYDPEP